MPFLDCSPEQPLPSILYGYWIYLRDNGICPVYRVHVNYEGGTTWKGVSGPVTVSLTCAGGAAVAVVDVNDPVTGCTYHFVQHCSIVPFCTGGELGPAHECCDGLPGPAVYGAFYGFTYDPVPEAVGAPFCICKDGRPSCPVSVSSEPVRYANGELQLRTRDLGADLPNQRWGHTRSFSNQMSATQTIGQGYNWLVEEWPHLVAPNADTMVVQSGANDAVWFDLVSGVYIPRHNTQQSLTFDAAASAYVLTDYDGTVTEFDEHTGMFRQRIFPSGNVIQATGTSPNGYNLDAVEQSVTTGGVTTVEKYKYAYMTTYGDALLESVTLTRQVGGSSLKNVNRVVYTYYGPEEAHGGAEDLKTAVTQVWDGTAWASTGTSYYRYYPEYGSSSSSSSSSSGGTQTWDVRAHLLKYVVNPSAFDRMVADGLDPQSVSDATLAAYADFFFEYDNRRRVTSETTKSGSQTHSFEYVKSDFSDDYNQWKTKTTETLPDGNQNIVYANYAGQTMLKVFQAGSDQWIEFWRYDENARSTLHAHPSAISGFDDSYADLLNYDSETGSYEYLRDDEGLIETSTYHTPSGNLTSSSVQKGQLGTSIPQEAWDYCQCGVDCGCSGVISSSSSSSSSGGAFSSGVWLLSRGTSYPSDTDPEEIIVTDHCYTFHGSTCAVKEHITTLPVVPTDQNGSGVAATSREYFDTYGNLIWRMDERGFITRMSYDIPTGAMIQQVDDVDTSLYSDAPAGWSTPSGGGLNLITDFEHDDQGRITQTLAPSHTVDVDGTATTVRAVTWVVYDDVNHITYTGQGYATGTSPSYTYTLVDPVSITKRDANGRVNEQIQATAPSTSGTLAEIINDAGGGEAAFPQSSYTRWTTSQYTDCCLAASQRVYHTIPASGSGSSGANYDETDYGYDVMKRRNRTVTPGGTITDIVYDAQGMVIGTYIGTNDDGGTVTDPTGGGGDPDNNMALVTANEYDGGTDGGDGNLTSVTQQVSATTTRVTSMTYDFRGRRATTDGEVDYFEKTYYNNLNHLVMTERYDTTSAGNLIARNEVRFDDRSRVYQTVRYEVDPSTGTVGNALTDNTWRDAAGNVIKSLPSGSKQFTKTTYDSLGRAKVTCKGYDLDETNYAEALSVSDDVIIEQVETTYDAASNAIQTTVRQRYHNAPDSQTGPLQTPTTTPKARVASQTTYPDAIGRTVATVNYGTNGGTALSRPATIPASSDTTLVTLLAYDSTGQVATQTNPAGIVSRFEYDDAGHRTAVILNASGSSSSSSSSASGACEPSDDVNVTVLTGYNADGNVATITAKNHVTSDQVTQYVYGTTLTDSDIASSLLKRAEIYPDSVDDDDRILFSYNRQRDVIATTDQNGTVHTFEFDKLGRQVHDRVTTLGTGVDGAVRRLSTTYEVRGMKASLTSWNDASVSSGDVVNECQFVYNGFSQLAIEYQSHGGAVNTSTSPKVQYGYASGSANTIRSTGIAYPNGRVISYEYGTSNGINDAISRIDAVKDGSTALAQYSYLGNSTFVITDYTEPGIKWTLADLAGSNDPDTGDIYSGFDRFGRVKDNRWYNYGTSSDVDRIKYGYDRNGNRTYRENTVATANGAKFDELYQNDLLDRLKHMDRGQLTALKDAITDKTFAQCWSLDPTANWKKFLEDDTGDGTWDLEQTRTANAVNEITDITDTVGPAWVTPAYNRAGNMTTMPKVADPTTSQTCTYDAWNRIVQVKEGVNTVSSYIYDAAKRRIIQKNYTAGTLSETRHLYYTEPSKWQVIEERLGTSPDSANAERQFVWGLRYIDNLIVRDRDTDGNGAFDERLYSLQDANWNVTAIVNASGTVQERYNYAAYGMPTFMNGTFGARGTSSFDWEILYCGYRWESVSRLFHVRNRVFHALIGAWTQRDPLGMTDGSNLYAYCNLNPLHGTDAFGLATINSLGESFCDVVNHPYLNALVSCMCGVINIIDAIWAALLPRLIGVAPAQVALLTLLVNSLDCACDIWSPITQICGDCPSFVSVPFTIAGALYGCLLDFVNLDLSGMELLLTQLGSFAVQELVSDLGGAGGAIPACIKLADGSARG
ncbi:MAG: RHS repeat-associated core domain-containing protein [Planctomycetota bacterium]